MSGETVSRKRNQSIAILLGCGFAASTVLCGILVYLYIKKKQTNYYNGNASGNDLARLKSINTITIVNSSTTPDQDIQRAVTAIQQQIDLDFSPKWGIAAKLIFVPKGQKAAVPPNNMTLYVLQNSDEQDALGYHTLTSDGLPIGKVFIEDTHAAGLPWSVVLSHEILEMIVDPLSVLTLPLQYGDTTSDLLSFEVCDPCQFNYYYIDGVAVSDFILPGYYTLDGSAHYDFLGLMHAPFQILANGYQYVFKQGTGWVTAGGVPYPVALGQGNYLWRPAREKQNETCARLKRRIASDRSIK